MEGADGVMSGEGLSGASLEMGLEENSEETISREDLERMIAGSATFCLLESLALVACSGDGSSGALAGRMGLV